MTVTKIEYFNGNTKIGERTEEPFTEFNWIDVPEGSHDLTAKLYIDGSYSTTSPVVNIDVQPKAEVTLSPYLADSFGGAEMAYSFRKVNENYTGNCIQVIDKTGNFHEIGFDGDYIDTTDLLNKVLPNGNEAYISIFYDQSGNNRNWESDFTSSNRLPNIVQDNDLILDDNGKVTAYRGLGSDGTTANLRTSISGISNVFDSLVIKDTTLESSIFGAGDSTSNYYLAIAEGSDADIDGGEIGSPTYRVNSVPFTGSTRGDISTMVQTGNLSVITINNLDLSTWEAFRYKFDNNLYYAPEYFYERIVWGEHLIEEQVEAIETNQLNYYQ